MARLQEICCDPYYNGQDETIPHHNGKTGELLFAMPGVNIRRVSRRKMRELFGEGLEINVCIPQKKTNHDGILMYRTVWQENHHYHEKSRRPRYNCRF